MRQSGIGVRVEVRGVTTCNVDSRRWQTSASPKPPGLMENAGKEADNAFVRGLMPTTGRHTTRARRTGNHEERRIEFDREKTKIH